MLKPADDGSKQRRAKAYANEMETGVESGNWNANLLVNEKWKKENGNWNANWNANWNGTSRPPY